MQCQRRGRRHWTAWAWQRTSEVVGGGGMHQWTWPVALAGRGLSGVSRPLRPLMQAVTTPGLPAAGDDTGIAAGVGRVSDVVGMPPSQQERQARMPVCRRRRGWQSRLQAPLPPCRLLAQCCLVSPPRRRVRARSSSLTTP